jgi:curved DNA-binding protein CbpA
MNSNQQTYYDLLAVHPSASAIEIRRAYRDLSKKYHPDTTTLTRAKATLKFQALNEAYAVISNPERRLAYDLEIGYSRVVVLQPTSFHPISSRPDNYRSSAYLDPTDRPLSGGEIAALFMLGITFIGCLVLAISIGMIRGEI